MTRVSRLLAAALAGGLALAVSGFCAQDDAPSPGGRRHAGILGKVFNEPDFRRIKRVLEPQSGLEAHFDDGIGHGRDWSGVWEGWVISPVTGPLIFHVRAHKPTTFDLFERGSATAEGTSDRLAEATVRVTAYKGEALPFKVTYAHAKGGLGGWAVTWSHSGLPPSPVPADALFFDDGIADRYHWTPDPDPATIDYSRFATVDARHVIVFHEPGRAAAWPANNAFRAWGNEILQTFGKGYHLDRGLNHSIDPTRPGESRQARSLDGGETWTEEPFVEKRPGPGEQTFPPPGLDFGDPDFVLKASYQRYWFSQDRGRTWHGPHSWPDLGVGELTNRTDCIPLGNGSALLGFSAKDEKIQAQHDDRAFFVRFDGRARELRFLNWLTPPEDLSRAVMPSTVLVGPNHFITAVRRKEQELFEDLPPISRNWIEVFESIDGAASWRSLGEVATTDNGRQNGNPPSLVHVGGSTLAVVYGYRGIPYTIRARVSRDLGRTWSTEIILRRDSTSWDMGYVRSAVRPDGRIVSIYYLPTSERPELHFEATIWDPQSVREPEPTA